MADPARVRVLAFRFAGGCQRTDISGQFDWCAAHQAYWPSELMGCQRILDIVHVIGWTLDDACPPDA